MSRRDTTRNNSPHNSCVMLASESVSMPDRVAPSTVAQCNHSSFHLPDHLMPACVMISVAGESVVGMLLD